MDFDQDQEICPNLDPDRSFSHSYIFDFYFIFYSYLEKHRLNFLTRTKANEERYEICYHVQFFLPQFLTVWIRIRIRTTDPSPQSC